ncbi:MAG TPA: DNA primase [Acidimicrobiales bacterium]|nr:DNA primase [Acidimicrobiales bacterium]
MAILDEDVARVRAESDFVAVASEHIALKRQGRRWVGLCPFHAEKTPSFSVNAEEGLYYCFGCQASGDVITFVREVEHLDFVGAVEALAARAGIQLRYDEAAGGERRRHKLLQDAMEKAVDFYHEQLLSGSASGAARRYLREARGYDGEVVRRFKIGWAPDDWDALSRALGLPDDVLRDTGLGFVNSRGRRQDAFRARIMFPIFDPGGRPVAFGGRLLPGARVEGPKYKNSADTPLYSKHRTLYGLNWAKGGIVEAGEVVVCEGYTDVIGMFQAGVPRAVATCGTSLADGHFRLLKNFARRVVLAYDADAAGQAAAEKFHEWERQFEMDIAVAALPAGADPGDVARSDPDALRAAVEGALPFMGFRVERVLGAADLSTPEGRAKAAEAALAVLSEHPNQLVRDQYVMVVAERCRIDPARLREMSERARSPHPAGHGPGAPAGPSSRTDARGRKGAPDRGPRRPHQTTAVVEVDALRLAVHRPEEVADRLEEQLFTDPVHQAAFRALVAAPTLHEAIDGAEPEAAALLQRLAVEDASEDDVDVTTADLARAAAAREVARLASLKVSEDQLGEVSRRNGWLKLQMEALSDPQERVEACRRLVAWLSEQVEGE